MSTTSNDKGQAFDGLLNIIDGTQDATVDDMRSFLSTKEGGEAWADMQDIGEAVRRKYGVAPDKDKAWQAFTKRVGAKPRKSRLPRIAAIAVAAAAAVLLLLTLMLPSSEPVKTTVRHKIALGKPKVAPVVSTVEPTVEKTARETNNPVVLTISTRSHETRYVKLADGTEVWLNAKSSLSYPERFTGMERKVSLNGEGYFKVSHDSRHPFIIEAGHLRTKVLGTEFNVRCYSLDNAHVTLVSGLVEVSTGDSSVRIDPSEDATIENGSLKVSRVNTKDFTSWRHGIMYFDNASLRAILQEMGGWYGLNVICNDNGLLDRRFHFMYNCNEPVDEALRLLNAISDINVTLENGSIVIK